MEELSEEERRALRGSKFAPPPFPATPTSSFTTQIGTPRRTIEDEQGSGTGEISRKKAKGAHRIGLHQLRSSPTRRPKCQTNRPFRWYLNSRSTIQHVDSFSDSEDSSEEGNMKTSELKKLKKKKKKNKKKKEMKKNKKRKMAEEPGFAMIKKPKRKSKL